MIYSKGQRKRSLVFDAWSDSSFDASQRIQPFYTSGWVDGNTAGVRDFMVNSSVTTRPNETMQSCPRTYCLGYWAGLVNSQLLLYFCQKHPSLLKTIVMYEC